MASTKNSKDPCWDGYEMAGTKKKDGKKVPNCVPKKADALISNFLKKADNRALELERQIKDSNKSKTGKKYFEPSGTNDQPRGKGIKSPEPSFKSASALIENLVKQASPDGLPNRIDMNREEKRYNPKKPEKLIRRPTTPVPAQDFQPYTYEQRKASELINEFLYQQASDAVDSEIKSWTDSRSQRQKNPQGLMDDFEQTSNFNNHGVPSPNTTVNKNVLTDEDEYGLNSDTSLPALKQKVEYPGGKEPRIKTYPNSSMIDPGLVHQNSITEKFLKIYQEAEINFQPRPNSDFLHPSDVAGKSKDKKVNQFKSLYIDDTGVSSPNQTDDVHKTPMNQNIITPSDAVKPRIDTSNRANTLFNSPKKMSLNKLITDYLVKEAYSVGQGGVSAPRSRPRDSGMGVGIDGTSGGSTISTNKVRTPEMDTQSPLGEVPSYDMVPGKKDPSKMRDPFSFGGPNMKDSTVESRKQQALDPINEARKKQQENDHAMVMKQFEPRQKNPNLISKFTDWLKGLHQRPQPQAEAPMAAEASKSILAMVKTAVASTDDYEIALQALQEMNISAQDIIKVCDKIV